MCFNNEKNCLGTQNEIDSAMVNEPLVFESLKFYCSFIHFSKTHFVVSTLPEMMERKESFCHNC